MNQYGGGKCSLCGSEGVSMRICPLNPSAINIKQLKHKPIKKVLPIKKLL